MLTQKYEALVYLLIYYYEAKIYRCTPSGNKMIMFFSNRNINSILIRKHKKEKNIVYIANKNELAKAQLCWVATKFEIYSDFLDPENLKLETHNDFFV